MQNCVFQLRVPSGRARQKQLEALSVEGDGIWMGQCRKSQRTSLGERDQVGGLHVGLQEPLLPLIGPGCSGQLLFLAGPHNINGAAEMFTGARQNGVTERKLAAALGSQQEQHRNKGFAEGGGKHSRPEMGQFSVNHASGACQSISHSLVVEGRYHPPSPPGSAQNGPSNAPKQRGGGGDCCWE